MKTMSKALVGTIAAGAMAISSATPAFAERHDRDGISAGDVIAGALIIGGIAAIASAASNNDRDNRYDDYRYGDNRYGDYRGSDYRYDRAGYGYGYQVTPRQAIEQCVYAAERYAGSRYGRADVTDIRDIDRTRYGYKVKGRIAVNTSGRDWRRGDSNYGRGWGGDYRGWNNSMRGYDSGSFECKFERGRVTGLDIDGIRGF